MTRNAASQRRPIRSFTHRARGLTKDREKEFASLLERYGRAIPARGFHPETLFERPGPITLEVGFGRGEALLDEVQSHVERNALGIEAYRPALFSVLRKAERAGINNLRVVSGDAAALLPKFPADCLRLIRILFPDPWPKRRHRKRRLLQERFLDECARCLAPGGLLHLATDWADYATQIERIVDEASFWRSVPDLPDRPETHFERRGRRLGHDIWERAFALRAAAGGQSEIRPTRLPRAP